MAEFHRKTRRIGFLHRCLLNPSTTYTNNARADETYTQREPREGMEQPLRVDLGSLSAMRRTVASLRCVPQSMQSVHRVIQSLFLFDVVSG
jgi:hypothetical protein